MSLRTIEELLKVEFQELYLRWAESQPLRTGLHASSLLVSDNEWCVRRHVLAEMFPDEAVQEVAKPWDTKKFNTFLHGWEVHRKWQHLFKHHFRDVVYNVFPGENGRDDRQPELDLTHYDEERNLFFSPDAILEWGGEQYIVEIKGINQEAFEGNPAYYDATGKLLKPERKGLSNNLAVAMSRNETVYKAVIQANMYCHLTGLKRAVILIENKNNQQFKVWVIEYDFELFTPYRDRIYDVKGTLALTKAGKPSAKMTRVCQSQNDTRARGCPMREVCFREKE